MPTTITFMYGAFGIDVALAARSTDVCAIGVTQAVNVAARMNTGILTAP